MSDLRPLDVPITVHFEKSFHFGTGQREGLINRTVRRSASGAPYVPASALKGALRQTAERFVRTLDGLLRKGEEVPDEWRLGMRRRGTQKTSEMCTAPQPADMCQSASPCLVCRVFGNTYSGRRLIVDDAYLDGSSPETKSLREAFRSVEEGNPEEEGNVIRRERPERIGQTETVTRLQMDRRRKGAQHGALFTTEYARGQAPFRGRLSGQVPLTPLEDGSPAELVLLAATLRSTDQIGGEASTGRGACSVRVESIEEGAGDGAGPPEPVLQAGDDTYHMDDLLEKKVLENLAWSEMDM
ncbi:MAG: RAMP superfamily CRISPR-associated protein [Salinibacter sp.]